MNPVFRGAELHFLTWHNSSRTFGILFFCVLYRFYYYSCLLWFSRYRLPRINIAPCLPFGFIYKGLDQFILLTDSAISAPVTILIVDLGPEACDYTPVSALYRLSWLFYIVFDIISTHSQN